MEQVKNKRNSRNTYTLVVAGVLVLSIILTFIAYFFSIPPLARFSYGLLNTSGIWLGCMIIVQFLWRKYPWEHKPVKHLLIEIAVITTWTMAFSGSAYFLGIRLEIFPRSEPLAEQIIITLLITYFITALHEAVDFYNQWKYNFSRSVRLEKDNIEAKYEALKNQVNPHFLFNSLNSLTTMVDDNPEAVDYIRNLSEFLRYMLGSREKEFVLVREEINILKSYICLQKSRFKNNLEINVEVPEKYYHFAVPPLVLQMLVENCIKHNVISKDKPLQITVSAENESILVENNLQKKSDVTSTGQGLKNIADRYRFFTTREVTIIENAGYFKVKIPLLTIEI